jgi:hypothetical protein
MTTILGLALCVVLAGARSFTAIGEWAANASPRVLAVLGSGDDPPCESTLRRTLQRLGVMIWTPRSGTGLLGAPRSPVCGGRWPWTGKLSVEHGEQAGGPGT